MQMETVLATQLAPIAKETARAISEENFDEIVKLHQRRVYRVIYLLLRDHDAADTLTQECFLRAYKHRLGFRGECRLDTWLIRIAVNLARDYGKNRRLSFWRKLVGLETDEIEIQVAAANPSAERVLLAREKLAEVWNALPSLPQQQRTIFTLRFAEEMSLEEIAEVLGLKIGSVKTHLFRATGAIRQKLRNKS
jgi:RNA polymerase sigma-70 factor (ECF subfamily)